MCRSVPSRPTTLMELEVLSDQARWPTSRTRVRTKKIHSTAAASLTMTIDWMILGLKLIRGVTIFWIDWVTKLVVQTNLVGCRIFSICLHCCHAETKQKESLPAPNKTKWRTFVRPEEDPISKWPPVEFAGLFVASEAAVPSIKEGCNFSVISMRANVCSNRWWEPIKCRVEWMDVSDWLSPTVTTNSYMESFRVYCSFKCLFLTVILQIFHFSY